MQRVLFASTLFLVSLFAIPFAAPPAHGILIGTVCIDSATSMSCPLSAPTFSGRVNTQLTVSVNIQGSDVLNGWDVRIKTDPTILNPLSDNIMPTVINPPFVIVANCINGIGICDPGDAGAGIVHVAVVGFPLSIPVVTGRLFAITYNIVGRSTGTTIGYQTGCTFSSNDSNCVLILNSPLVVPENVQPALFRNHKNDVDPLGQFILITLQKEDFEPPLER